jgi:hypothetical protein
MPRQDRRSPPSGESDRSPAFQPLEGRRLFAASAGLEFIGLSSQKVPNGQSDPQNAAAVASVIKSSGVRNPVIGLLPFEFNPGAPFANALDLVQRTLPSVRTLTVDVYLKWFPHDGGGPAAQASFWQAASKTATVQAGFLNRIAQADQFRKDAAAWAKANHIAASKLRVEYIPVLEDACTSMTEYRNLMTAMARQESHDGVAAARVRRSALFENAFRVPGATLELHGTWAQASTKLDATRRPLLRAGDTWTPDGDLEGYITSSTGFLADERKTMAKGINVQFWDGTFNGSPRGHDNDADRFVNPFASGAVTKESIAALALGD